MDKLLKPIGTEYWYDFPSDPCSTDARRKRFKYRVINHVLTIDGFKEELKAIDYQYKEDNHE